MFYLGGMTLGYFTPPAPKSVKPDSKIVLLSPKNQAEQEATEERKREQELARAFLTPWHLFY